MASRRGRVAASLIDNQIIVCGGSDGHKELNTGEFIDLTSTQKSSTIKELPAAVVHAGKSMLPFKSISILSMFYSILFIAMCNDKHFLYLIGGLEGDKCKNECYRYDPRSNEWNSLPSMSQERSQAAAVYFDKKLYVFGGSSLSRCLSSCEIFNLTTKQWNFGPAMKENRRGCGAIVYHDKVFVVGGSNGVTSLVSVEIFDLKSNEWLTNINGLTHRLNIPRIGLGLGICTDRLYAIGGFDGRHFLKSIEIYDETSQQWFLNNSNPQ